MKIILLILSVVLLASCSTTYRNGQTPDDLYYSKGKVKLTENDRYEAKTNNYQDMQIRMQAYDYRWRTLDAQYDYDYGYNPYSYGYNYGYYYNPYYCPYPVYNNGYSFTTPKNATIRTTNLSAYNNTVLTNTPTKANPRGKAIVIRGYNNNNTQTTRNTDYEPRVYAPSNSTSVGNNSNTSNTNSSSSSTPSSSSSGSSISRPGRGN